MRCPRPESTAILCQVDNGSQKSNPDPVFVSCFSKLTNPHRFRVPFEALQIPNVLDGWIVNWMFILLLKMEFIRVHWNYRHSWRLAIDAYRVLKILTDKFIDILQSFVDEQCSGQIQCEFRGVNLVFHGVTRSRLWAVFASCVLCLRSAFCVMLGARRMLGATENMEFNNIY